MSEAEGTAANEATSTTKRVALLELRARADGFIGDSAFASLGGRLQERGHHVELVSSVQAVDAPDDPVAWHARLADFVRRGDFDTVVLARVWAASTIDALRSAMRPGAALVRLTNGVGASLDGRFDHVLGEPGLIALLDGAADVPNAAWRRTSARELRMLTPVPAGVTLDATALPGRSIVDAAPAAPSGRPTLSGPASGCPFLLDAAKNPIFSRLAIDRDKVQMKGCTFCLDNTGAFAVPTEAAVLDAWLGQLRRVRARDPGAREFLLTDERPHPYLPAFFRAVHEEGLGPVELMIKSRVDWLLEFAEGPVSAAATIAEASGSVLHVYLVGFESFEPFHLELFNKGSSVADNVAAIAKLRELAARFPKSFEYLRFRAHGIVMFTPWTRPEHLLENARVMREVRFHELRDEAVRTRLRLYPRVPLHALAEADGLLVESFEEGRGDRAAEQGYDASAPWRFQDERMEAIYRIAIALSRRHRMLTDADVVEAATRFVLRWPGLSSVPEDAYFPVEQAMRIWAPSDLAARQPPEPRPGSIAVSALALTIGFDPEVDLVASGSKRACLKEGVPTASAQGLVRAYRAMGLAADVVERHGLAAASDTHEHGDDFAIVAVAHDAASLASVLDAQRRHHAREPERGGEEPAVAMGALMGYPACCVKAFAAQAERGDNLENERLAFRRAPGATLHPLLNRLADVRLISHHLCAADCAASIRVAEAVLERLAAISPEVASWVQGELSHPLLCIDYDRRVRLHGAFDGDIFVVEEATPIGGAFGRMRDQDFVIGEFARFAVSPRGVSAELRDGRRVELHAEAPLLIVPGAALTATALAAIGGPLAQGASHAKAPLPAAVRAGVRVLGYRILGVRAQGSDHIVTLGNGAHRFDLHVWVDDAARSHVARRGRWSFDVDAPEALPEPGRAAVAALTRAFTA